jgi:hypothetical protein
MRLCRLHQIRIKVHQLSYGMDKRWHYARPYCTLVRAFRLLQQLEGLSVKVRTRGSYHILHRLDDLVCVNALVHVEAHLEEVHRFFYLYIKDRIVISYVCSRGSTLSHVQMVSHRWSKEREWSVTSATYTSLRSTHPRSILKSTSETIESG